MTLIILSVLTISSCTQFEDIGSNLVDDEKLLISTDTILDYELQTFKRDSLFAYVRQGLESDFVPSTHILGQYNDPVFGYTRYDLTAQMQLSPVGVDFSEATFDSAFLLLSYDTTFSPYGETEAMQTLDVYELTNREMPEKVFVEDEFEIEPNAIGSLTFAPAFKNQNRGDSLSAPSHIRVPMTEEFGEKILSLDTSVTASVLNFLDEFAGIVVRPRENAFNGAYRFFAYPTSSAGQSNNSDVAAYSGIRIYYTKDGESKEAYLKMSGSLHHFTTVEHRYEGSVLESVLNDQPADPEYMYIQPTGVGVRIAFDDVSKYQNKVINDVSLTWRVAEHPLGDTSTYQPMPALFALEKESIADRTPITDILFYQSGGAYRQFFGGVLQDNNTTNGNQPVYTFNITNQFQHIVDGSADPEIFIVPTHQDVSRIARSVLHGPGAADTLLQPSIKITYSSTNH